MKHRSKAVELIETGSVRLNRTKVAKTSQSVKPGDILTLSLARSVNVVRIIAEPERRGGAVLSASIYELISAETFAENTLPLSG